MPGHVLRRRYGASPEKTTSPSQIERSRSTAASLLLRCLWGRRGLGHGRRGNHAIRRRNRFAGRARARNHVTHGGRTGGSGGSIASLTT